MSGPQYVLLHGVVPSQVQDFAVLLVELHEVLISPFLQPVEVYLYGSMTLWHSNHSSQFSVIFRLAAGRVCPIISLMKMVNRTGPSVDLLDTPLVTGLQIEFAWLITTL